MVLFGFPPDLIDPKAYFLSPFSPFGGNAISPNELAAKLEINAQDGWTVLMWPISQFTISGTPADGIGREYTAEEFANVFERWRKSGQMSCTSCAVEVRGLTVSNTLKAYHTDGRTPTVAMKTPLVQGQILWLEFEQEPIDWSQRLPGLQLVQLFARFLAQEFTWRAYALKVFGREVLEYSNG